MAERFSFYRGPLFKGRMVHLRGDDGPRELTRLCHAGLLPSFWSGVYGAYGRSLPEECHPIFQVADLDGFYHRGHLQLEDTMIAHALNDALLEVWI